MLRRFRSQAQTGTSFGAEEVAEYEYCPLIWWNNRFGSYGFEDNEALFAQMVQLEQEYGADAPIVPEYQMLEQLLLQNGAFDEETHQKATFTEQLDEGDKALASADFPTTGYTRRLLILATVLLVLAAICIGITFLLPR